MVNERKSSNNVFSSLSEKYLQDKMSICVFDLNKKILLDFPNNYIFFNYLIEFMMNIKVPYLYSKVESLENRKNQEYINDELYSFLNKYNLDEGSSEHFIFDNIRHAFINYKKGGVLRMYQGREAEVWYPKVIINKYMGIKEDIDKLENEIIIYRGTSKDEFNSNKFGQSWSIDKNIACDFAFKHYENQIDYKNTKRVLLKSKIQKEFVYYYSENGREKEIIIDSKKIVLHTTEILEERIL